jgi:hypothetical protein
MSSAIVSRRRALLAAAGLALTTVAAFVVPASSVLAHETNCPVCALPVVQDTAAQDNEVALRFGRKRIEYRCVWCALSEAPQYKGDVTVLAPSEVQGRPVSLTRTAGKWSASPSSAVFVGVKASHKVCPTTYRAFTTKAAFDAWVAKNQPLLKGAQPLTLDQMVALK